MPSSSARCAQFPRAQDKVHYYIKLKDLRDQLKGIERNTDVQEVQYTFDLQLAQGLFPSLPLSISHVQKRKEVVDLKQEEGKLQPDAVVMDSSVCSHLLVPQLPLFCV